MAIKKGIILAGGTGSRLFPLNQATNKQLLPIFDKPAIYYPLSTLMLSGIEEVLIISSPHDLAALKNLFKDGSQFGLRISYAPQSKPSGLPEAFIIGDQFIDDSPVTLILGDNFYHGQGLSNLLIENHRNFKSGAQIYTYNVDDPSRYGVAQIENSKIVNLVEKPSEYISDLAITGLYSFDGSVAEKAKSLKPSNRNETLLERR
jgi:glucose-1-phosphate thymidylyltransferase